MLTLNKSRVFRTNGFIQVMFIENFFQYPLARDLKIKYTTPIEILRSQKSMFPPPFESLEHYHEFEAMGNLEGMIVFLVKYSC